MEINNNYFLVTGAGSGLGFATAQRLLEAGANVVMTDRNSDIRRIAEQLGERAVGLQGDVASENDMQKAVALATGPNGLHGVVHCAGIAYTENILGSDGKPAGLDNYRNVLETNLVGTFNVIRLAAAAMHDNHPDEANGERGVIITVSSICAFDGGAGTCAYAASKAGVAAMVLPAARELGAHGIRLMSVAPGPFGTAMLADKPVERVQASVQIAAFPKRLGNAAEFASLVEHIIRNVMLNAETIRLDGGVRLR